jgi:hypothetical protein
MVMPTPQVQQQQHPVANDGTSMLATPTSIPMSPQGRNPAFPTEWSVEEVVDWLKSKGFDQDVCDKFIGEYINFGLLG